MTSPAVRILYEDNHLIVAVKPSGVLSQADGSGREDMLSLIKGHIKEKYGKPGAVYLGLVHRLDRNVAGVMVFARTSKAAARLSEAIRNHAMTKEYLAVAAGDFPVGSSDVWRDRLAKDEGKRMAVVDEDGGEAKAAELSYTAIARTTFGDRVYSLLRVTLVSGRFHQIRLQFASRGTPLFNDRKYGGEREGEVADIGLFAARIVFPHPVTGLPMEFSVAPDGGPFRFFPDEKKDAPKASGTTRT